MKKYFLLLAFVCLLVSCKKEENPDSAKGVGVMPPAFDTSDININNYIDSKVFIPSSISGTLLGNSLSVRCRKTVASCSDAEIIIISNDIVKSYDNNTIVEIAKALHKGRLVGYLYPSSPEFKKFAGDLRGASEALLKDSDFRTDVDCFYFQHLDELLENSLLHDASESFARMVSICNDGIFVIGGINDATTSCTYTELDPETLAETVHDVEIKDESFEDTPHGVGNMAELFVKWANEKMGGNAMAANDLEPVRREFRYVNSIYFDARDITDCALSRSMDFEIFYEFWPVCDHADNTIKDVYAVRRTFKINGDELKTGPIEKEYWWVNSKNEAKYYGPYLRRVMDNTSCNAVSAMRELKPLNHMSSTTYNESTSFGVSIGMGIGANPSVNPSFSYSKQYATVTTVPDIATYVKAADERRLPQYTFMSEKRPNSHWGLPITHDIVPNNYNEYLELQTSWIWDISAPRDEAHACTDYVEIDIEMMDFSKGFFKTTPGYYDKTFKFTVDYNLTALPHYSQRWGVEVNNPKMTRSEKLELMAWLENRYKDYYSSQLFNVSAYSLNERTGIEKFRINFIDVLKNDIQIWKDLDYYGTFTFTWRNNMKPDETYTYDFVVNK